MEKTTDGFGMFVFGGAVLLAIVLSHFVWGFLVEDLNQVMQSIFQEA